MTLILAFLWAVPHNYNVQLMIVIISCTSGADGVCAYFSAWLHQYSCSTSDTQKCACAQKKAGGRQAHPRSGRVALGCTQIRMRQMQDGRRLLPPAAAGIKAIGDLLLTGNNAGPGVANSGQAFCARTLALVGCHCWLHQQ